MTASALRSSAIGRTDVQVEGVVVGRLQSGRPRLTTAIWLALTAVAITMTPVFTQVQERGERVVAQVDHLVYATPDLDLGIRTIEKLTGVRATVGGQHPGLGTRSALVALGASVYLEIIGPDPGQPRPAGPLRFGIDDLRAPRLIGWVAKSAHLVDVVKRGQAAGMQLGDVVAGSRKLPDGAVLAWRYTDPSIVIERRLVPYFIDWGGSPHPSATAARGVTLVSLRAEHPQPERVGTLLKAVGLDLPVTKGPAALLIATLATPNGSIELRGAQ
jgi:hypothetical protein